jgi:hypothetical protein
MSAREVIARAIEPDAFDQPPEFEPWAAQRRASAYAKAHKYLAALDAAGLAVVPKEPTRELRDCLECEGRGFYDGSGATCAVCGGEGEMLTTAKEGALAVARDVQQRRRDALAQMEDGEVSRRAHPTETCGGSDSCCQGPCKARY